MRNKKTQKAQLNISSTKFYFYINGMFLGAVKSLHRVGSSLAVYHDRDSCAIINFNIAS